MPQTLDNPLPELPTAPCRVAFKEWGAVCLALEAGRQSVLLRKGGIHEGRAGFRVSHQQFWLYPTRFHESPQQLVPEAAGLALDALQLAPPAGRIGLRSLAVVSQVFELRDLALLDRLVGEHILAPATVASRFHYREPSLFVLLIRVFSGQKAHELPETASMAGCRSWVELDTPLPTAGLQPVLSDARFEQTSRRIISALNPTSG